MSTILLNGKEHAIDAELSLAELLEAIAAPQAGTAVAVNGAIVPRERHAEHVVRAGDRVEIVRAIGGG